MACNFCISPDCDLLSPCSKMVIWSRTWKTYSLWVLVYFDAVCRKLLVNSHCLHRTYTPTNVLPDGRSAVKCFTELSTRLNELFHDKLSNMVGFLHTFDGLVELRRINVCSSCHLWLDKFWLSLVQTEACCCCHQAIAWTNVNPMRPGYNWIFSYECCGKWNELFCWLFALLTSNSQWPVVF